MRFTSLSQKIPDLGVTRALRKIAARNARRRSIRQMEALSLALQRDVGWPEIARRLEACDRETHHWM